jgi:hypothetical protein
MEQTPAASSPAEVEDVFRGEYVSHDEFSKYRLSGELPERFKAETAEPAPADTPEETVESEPEEGESEPESDPEESQEQPQKGSGAEKRIKQLLAKIKDLESKAAPAKQDVNPAPSAAQSQPQSAQNYQEWRKTFKAAEWEAKYIADHPESRDYAEVTAAMADYLGDIRDQFKAREQHEQQARNALKTKMDDARSRYEDADDVIFPAATAINTAQIPVAVKQVIAESDVFPDLLYVLNSDEGELKKFISLAQSNPRAALAKTFEYERGIREELSKTGDEPESRTPPEKKITKAPKPPAPVGGGSSRAFDVSDESLSPEEWARKRTAEVKRRKG